MLKHQSFRPMLKYQAWLTTHVRNPEDFIELIYPSERSNRLDLSISSGIISLSERPISLLCPFRLALWKKENFLLLMPEGA